MINLSIEQKQKNRPYQWSAQWHSLMQIIWLEKLQKKIEKRVISRKVIAIVRSYPRVLCYMIDLGAKVFCEWSPGKITVTSTGSFDNLLEGMENIVYKYIMLFTEWFFFSCAQLCSDTHALFFFGGSYHDLVGKSANIGQ